MGERNGRVRAGLAVGLIVLALGCGIDPFGRCLGALGVVPGDKKSQVSRGANHGSSDRIRFHGLTDSVLSTTPGGADRDYSAVDPVTLT